MSSCGCPTPKKEAPKEEKKAEKCGSGLLGFLNCGQSKGDSKCPPTCPPMPCFDTSMCKPAWAGNPPKPTTKTYPAPEGVEIVPISVGGRYGSGAAQKAAGKCGSCGSVPEPPRCGKPKVGNKDCPMMRPRCPGDEKKDSGNGFFAKLASIFGGKVEDECPRDTLVVRQDGYLSPLYATASCAAVRDFNGPPKTELQECQRRHEAEVEKVEAAEQMEEQGEECPCEEQEEAPEPEEPPCPPCGYYKRGSNEYIYDIADLFFGPPTPPCPPPEEVCDCGCSDPEPEPECVEEVPEPEPACVEEVPEPEPECVEEIPEPIPEPEPECIEEVPEPEPVCECEPVLEPECEPEPEPVCECEPEPECIEEIPEPVPEPDPCAEPPAPEPAVDPECAEEVPPPKPNCPAIQRCPTLPKAACDSNCIPVPPGKKVIKCCYIIIDDPCAGWEAAPEAKPEVPDPCAPAKVEDPSAPPKVEKDPCAPVDTCAPPKAQDASAPIDPCATPKTKDPCAPPKIPDPSAPIDPCAPEPKVTQPEVVVKCPRCFPEYPVKPGEAGPEGPCTYSDSKFTDSSELPRIDPPPPAPEGPCSVIPELTRIVTPEEVSKKAQDILDSPCQCQVCKNQRGDDVCLPPRKPTCGECGGPRGSNECCTMCKFSKRMDSVRCRGPEEDENECEAEDPCAPKIDRCNSGVFDLKEDGKPCYEGGMCMTRAEHFLWKNSDGPNGFADLAYEGTKFTGFGVPDPDEEELKCTCEEHLRQLEEDRKRHKYMGGMTLQEYADYIWRATTQAPK